MQWDPEQAPIPINLSEQSVRAYRQLEKQPGIPADLILKEIWIGSYTPLAAIQAQKADIESNLHHWIVTFSFSALIAPTEPGYDVNMLLDGRIISAVRARQ